MSGPVPNKVTFPPPVAEIIMRLSQGKLDAELATEAAKMIVGLASQVNGERLMVCLLTNTVVYRGIQLKLTPNQAVILHTLATAYPGLVSIEELARAVWGHRAQAQINNIRVWITELRAKLAVFDVIIGNRHGRGYYLNLDGRFR